MKTNARSTLVVESPPGVRTARQLRIVEMAALEALPAAVRRYLNEHAIDLPAWKVKLYYDSISRQAAECGGSPLDAEVWTMRKLIAVESQDLDAFARKYAEAYRLALPHAGAGATVLRYGPLEADARGRLSRSLARRRAGPLPMPVQSEEAA